MRRATVLSLVLVSAMLLLGLVSGVTLASSGLQKPGVAPGSYSGSSGQGSGAPAPAASGNFKTPSGNIVCLYSPGFVGCGIKSGLKPKPPYTAACKAARLDYNADRVGLGSTGRARPSACSGDAGPFAGEATAWVLRYGKTWNGVGVRCTSAAAGLTCRNKSGHGFFLSRERWRSF